MQNILVSVPTVCVILLSSSEVMAQFNFDLTRNLGPPVNTAAGEEAPSISADGLSLYFTANQGNRELIYVTTRRQRRRRGTLRSALAQL